MIMHFSGALFTSLMALVSVTTASPHPQRRQSTVTPPARYYLQTQVVGDHKDCGTNKTDLWISSYHTGAGLGDAVLSANKTSAMEGYLNGTQQLFTYPGNQIGGFSLVTISIAQAPMAYEGFYFNSTGLQYNDSIAGWLACDWWHSTPQLFNIDGYNYGPLPNSCSMVNLLPVAV